MSYKYSRDYDEIIDVGADAEFIWKLHFLEPNIPYNVIWEQMHRVYELECDSRKLALMPAKGKEWWYEEEFHLNYRIQQRANMLMEFVKIKFMPVRHPDVIEKLGEEYYDVLKTYEDEVVEHTISILKTCLFIFENKGTNVLFGKERNIERYKQLYQQLTSQQEELQEQGKQKLFPSLTNLQK